MAGCRGLRARLARGHVLQVDRAIQDNLPERDVNWPEEGTVTFAPDGRWVLYTPQPLSSLYQGMVLYDRETDRRHDISVGRDISAGQGIFEMGKFFPDGKSLILAGDNLSLKRVPYHDGTLDWVNAKAVGPQDRGIAASLRFHDFRVGADPNRVYGYTRHNSVTAFLFDLKSGTRTDVDLKAFAAQPMADQVALAWQGQLLHGRYR